MKPATTSAASGSRIGRPARAPDERRDHGHRRPDVAARLQRVGQQHFAAEPLRLARFVPHDDDRLIADRDDHDDEAGDRDLVRRRAAGQMIEGVAQHLDHDEQQEHRDGGGRHRLVLAVPVGMILVGRPARGAHADEADDVRRRVGQRMEAVGEDADGAAGVAEGDLRDRDGQIQDQHAHEDARRRIAEAVGLGSGLECWTAGRQNTRAVGTGHQRSCTLPMMYFFGTMPQCRLSELLFRWSPMTK